MAKQPSIVGTNSEKTQRQGIIYAHRKPTMANEKDFIILYGEKHTAIFRKDIISIT